MTQKSKLGSRFEEAMVYAAQIHQTQKRKGTEIPYVTHLLSVAAIVGENGGDEDEMIAGLLHDAVEDQGGKKRLEDIRGRFGDRVASIIEDCSDTDTVPKPPWKERKINYLNHLKKAPPSSLLVSCADKLHNARAIVADLRIHGEETWKLFNGGKENTLWYYRSLADDFLKLQVSQDLASELNRVVDLMESLAKK